jgi:hypothetical protein
MTATLPDLDRRLSRKIETNKGIRLSAADLTYSSQLEPMANFVPPS